MQTRRLLAVVAVFSLAACESIDRTPSALGVPAGELGDETLDVVPSVAGDLRQQHARLLRHEGSVTFARGTATMWAVRGQTRIMRLHYGDGTPFATFTVGANTLVSDASGAPLAPGDSVKITMRLLTPSAFVVEMQPSGIRFNADAPATLQFNLARAGRNALRSEELSFWKQETSSSPWESVPAVFDYQQRTATASVSGFTLYAIAD